MICSLLILLWWSPVFITSATPPNEVFIATGQSAHHHHTPSRRKIILHPHVVTTATDAAIAMNSIAFIELLSGAKNTADIKTYTRAPIFLHSVADGSSNNYDKLSEGNSESERLSSGFASTSNETVSEYLGRLWFLPETGIRFRETIRILSVSTDGQSSTVECITQYQRGSRWIDCSRIICTFSSASLASVGSEKMAPEKKADVKMELECELLVWLPMPNAVSKQVASKIRSVFETVALDFFKELASR